MTRYRLVSPVLGGCLLLGLTSACDDMVWPCFTRECVHSRMDDHDGDGYSSLPANNGERDCDDEDPSRYPGAPGWYLDGDGDGYGDRLERPDPECMEGVAYVTPGEEEDEGRFDCDDGDRAVNPGEEEIPYDGTDQDCRDGDLVDVDGDSYEGGPQGLDCNDLDGDIHPGAVEVATDDQGLDDDCDGGVDEGDTCANPEEGELGMTYSRNSGDYDSDIDESLSTTSYMLGGDVFWRYSFSNAGDVSFKITDVWCAGGDTKAVDLVVFGEGSCDEPVTPLLWGTVEIHQESGVLEVGGPVEGGVNYLVMVDTSNSLYSCEITMRAVSKSTEVTCGASASECVGTHETGADIDGDGTTGLEGDCDDNDPAAAPGLPEVCDNKDNDCDSGTDEGLNSTYYVDMDGDFWGSDAHFEFCKGGSGYTTVSGDCNDNDEEINPGRIEVCDGIDNDCDGVADDGLTQYYIQTEYEYCGTITYYCTASNYGCHNADVDVSEPVPPDCGWVVSYSSTTCLNSDDSAKSSITREATGLQSVWKTKWDWQNSNNSFVSARCACRTGVTERGW